MATPKQVRAALKASTPYGVEKAEGSWKITGGDAHDGSWDRTLCVYTFEGKTAQEWVEIISGISGK
jgi:hypothetical protein